MILKGDRTVFRKATIALGLILITGRYTRQSETIRSFFWTMRIQKGLTLENLVWAFTHFTQANWHPLTWISHMLDCSLWGLNSGKHHVVNVAFHSANTVLLFLCFSADASHIGNHGKKPEK
jgi:hypothetical protein